MTYQMKQCNLTRRKDHQLIRQTAWIPEKFAKKGEIVKINEAWWKITFVGTESKASDYIDDRSQDYKRTRKTSDI